MQTGGSTDNQFWHLSLTHPGNCHVLGVHQRILRNFHNQISRIVQDVCDQRFKDLGLAPVNIYWDFYGPVRSFGQI